MSELLVALAELQANPPKITKRGKGQVGSREYRYATLDAIWAALEPWRIKHGIIWVCCPNMVAGRPVLSYRLESMQGGVPIFGDYPLTDAHGQALGADITYARRYALCAVLGLLADEDTDGRPLAPRERSRARVDTDHERLANSIERIQPEDRPAERTRKPSPDQWQITPPGDRPATEGQQKFIHKLFHNQGISDDSVRHGMLSEILGRPVESQRELTITEANQVISYLKGDEEG